MARARDLKNERNSVLAVIGDGARRNGFKKHFNDVGYSKTKMTIILNDNENDLSKNIGGLNMLLSKLRAKIKCIYEKNYK